MNDTTRVPDASTTSPINPLVDFVEKALRFFEDLQRLAAALHEDLRPFIEALERALAEFARARGMTVQQLVAASAAALNELTAVPYFVPGPPRLR